MAKIKYEDFQKFEPLIGIICPICGERYRITLQPEMKYKFHCRVCNAAFNRIDIYSRILQGTRMVKEYFRNRKGYIGY